MLPTPDQILDLVPFARTMGIEFPSLTPESVTARLPWRDGYSTIGGGLHGGAVMGLADVTAAVAAVVASGDPRNAPATVASSTSFLHAVRGDAVATTSILNAGSTLVVVRVVVTAADAPERVCVDVVQTVLVRAPRAREA